MNRYAPELALIAGAILGLAAGGFVLFSLGEPASAIVATAVCWYPFAAYAVATSESPTAVVPPRLVTVVAGGAAIIVWGGIVAQRSATVEAGVGGLLLALCVFLPVASYACRYGAPPARGRSEAVFVATTLGAAGLLAVGGLAATGAAAVSALLVYLAGWLFYAAYDNPTQQRHRHTLLGGMGLAAGLVVVAGLTAGPSEPLVAAALVAAFGPLFGYVLTTDRR
ncbi:hypothetical protein [Halonotius roseus]|uniref:Uncharacterized protein n=1 Tax=Halonotius roseus TaxID=2511997 RepID=A0A544QPN2_9EURY|nr:hypothetical protein [Halonotius roseus]TQQ81386.1 hypothetical protein EWF95_00105 [Halonotius roseus]